jgi:hypothetical protein
VRPKPAAPAPAEPHPSAHPSAQPGAQPSAQPSAARLDVVPFFAPLFVAGARFVYEYGRFVDPHAAQPISRKLATARVECNVVALVRYRRLLVSTVTCAPLDATDSEGGDTTLLGELGGVFLTDGDALWLLDDAPESDDEAHASTDATPYLETPLEKYEDVRSDGADRWEHRVFEAPIQAAGKTVTAWCRLDIEPAIYGSLVKRCFAPRLGLVAARFEGRSGPSEEEMKLVAIKVADGE